jgi:hypothetical protein
VQGCWVDGKPESKHVPRDNSSNCPCFFTFARINLFLKFLRHFMLVSFMPAFLIP